MLCIREQTGDNFLISSPLYRASSDSEGSGVEAAKVESVLELELVVICRSNHQKNQIQAAAYFICISGQTLSEANVSSTHSQRQLEANQPVHVVDKTGDNSQEGDKAKSHILQDNFANDFFPFLGVRAYIMIVLKYILLA